MKNLAVVIAGLLVLTGCSSVETEDVSYSLGIVENVEDTRPSDDDVLVEVTPSTDEGELEPVDAPIVEEEVVQEDVQVSEPRETETALPEPSEAPIIEEPAVSFVSNLSNFASPVETCKIQQTNRIGYENKGFPHIGGIPHLGTVNVAIVAMDFENAQGSGSVSAKFGHIEEKLESWSKKWSFGKMAYEVQIHDGWIRAPKGAEWYNCPECHGEGVRKQSDAESLAQIIQAIDPYYNLAGIDFIGIIVPPKANEEYFFGIYGLKNASTDEGRQSFATFGGLGIQEGISLWDLWIHEILHFQGFVGHGPGNGVGYGVMQNQWGPSKAVNLWEGFVATWYGANEVACIDATDIDDNLYVELGSIDSFGSDYEGLVIKLNNEEVLVVEHRKVYGSEILAYKVNINAPTYRDDRGGYVADEKNWWYYLRESDGNVRIDKSVSFGGVTIKNLGDGRLEISR